VHGWGSQVGGTRIALILDCWQVFATAVLLPDVGGSRYGAGMPNQPGPGDSSPDRRPPPGRRPPGGQPTPHDSVFRRIFSVPENMASQLRAVLPPGLAGRLDLDRLTPVPASFVDEALKWRYSDLLFTAPLDGRDAFVYLLAEHQSSADPLMAYRMLRYVTRIWDQHLRDHPRARRLPAVIPLVVFHGSGRWARPVQLLELIDLDPATKEAAQAYLPRFEFLLDDLADVDGRRLLKRDLTPSALITLLLLKTAPGNPRIPAELRSWAGQLRAVLDKPGGGEAFTALLTYIELVSEAPTGELRDLATSLGPDAEEAYVTTAEMLRAEGEARGEARGRAEALVEMLTIKFGPLPESLPKTVHAASIDQIKAWAARAVTAGTLDQVFG
jgi:predicted transposase YdaD